MSAIHKLIISPVQKLLIRLCIFPTILSACTLLISYLNARTDSPALAFWEYSAMLESIFAALAITACGVVLVRYAEQERR